MNLDVLFQQNPGIVQAIRLFALVVTLLHVLWGLVIFRQFLSASRMITTATVAKLRWVMIVHLVLLTVILVLVVFY